MTIIVGDKFTINTTEDVHTQMCTRDTTKGTAYVALELTEPEISETPKGRISVAFLDDVGDRVKLHTTDVTQVEL